MEANLIFIAITTIIGIVFVGIKYTITLKKKILWGVTVSVILSYVALLIIQLNNFVISNMIVFLTSILAGSVIGTTISNESALIMYSLTAAVMDVLSFSRGLTNKLISSYQSGESLFVQYLVISIPSESGLILLIGIGDLLIVSGMFYALKQLNYSDIECFFIPFIGVLIALTIGLMIGGIAAIPFMALTVVSYIIYKIKYGRRKIKYK